MDYKICYKNHDKIVKIYKYLKSKNGKKNFYNKIELLKEQNSKKVMLLILKNNWTEYHKLLKIFEKICERIIKYKLSNKITETYVTNLHKILGKINSPKQLYNFIYKLLDEKNLYNRILKLYELLSDKYKCVIMLK